MAIYPRKQTVVIFLLCTLVVGGLAFYVRKGSGTNSSAPKEQVAVAAYDEHVLPSNTNWQTQFLSENTASGTVKFSGQAAKTEIEEDLTATAMLGRDFMTKYVDLHESGLSNDPDSVTAVMDQVVVQGISSVPLPKTYSSKNLRIVEDNLVNLKAYSSLIDSVQEQYLGTKDAASIAMMAFEDNDFEELALIDPIITTYSSIISHLAAAPVPQELAAAHIDLLNNFSAALYSAQSFRHIDADPLQSLAAIKFDAVSAQNIDVTFSELQQYFTLAKT